MMTRILPLIVALCTLASLALADGKVFRHQQVAEVAIPDQAALIHVADGVQTLVIETRYDAKGSPGATAASGETTPPTPYAWVVPLPSVPTDVFPVSSGVFDTLRVISQPHVRAVPPDVAWLAYGVAGGILLLGLVRRHAILRVGVAAGIILLILAAVLLPALGAARAGADIADTSVTIHQRQTVGDYDTVVISAAASDPDAPDDLITWLETNHFAVDPEARQAIAAYVADGWCFVASRLHTHPITGAAQAPHPLGFRFPAATPVYPLRLTATHGSDVSIELFVFAGGAASAQGFEVRRCAEAAYPDAPAPRWSRQDLQVGHPGLKALVADAPVATHLRATLSPAAMQTDATLTIGPFMPRGNQIHSRAGARQFSLNMASVVTLVLMLVIYIIARMIEMKPGPLLAAALIPLVIGALFGIVMNRAMPAVETTSTSVHTVSGRHVDRLADALSRAIEPPDSPPDLDRVRANVEAVLRDAAAVDDFHRLNPFTGQPRRVAASPGNVDVELVDGHLHLVLFDAIGMPWTSESPLRRVED